MDKDLPQRAGGGPGGRNLCGGAQGGGLPAAEAITVGAWLDYWLEEIVRPNLEYTTYYCYANIIRNHLKPSLGRVLLRELTPLRIQQYYTQMIKGKGLSPNTVHKHHILLHTALKLAFRQEILGSNPVDRVEPPRARAARQLYYTPQELKLLFQAAEGGRMELIVKLAGYLGLRRGEICGLRWENIDFRKKVLSVRLARTTAGGTVVEKPPKTPNSLRSLGFAGLEDLERLLRRTREEQRAAVCAGLAEDTGFVLADRRGRPWNPNQVTRAMEAFVEVNGLPPHYSPRPAPHLCQCGQQRPHPAAGYQPCAGAQGRGGDGQGLYPYFRPDPCRGGQRGGQKYPGRLKTEKGRDFF